MTPHPSQRGYFFAALYDEMRQNKKVWLLTADLGYGALDSIRDTFPDRFVNCGASEQAMIGAAVGLALDGQIPFCYSITNFLLYRPFEWLRNYVNYENIPVRLVGSGLDHDYENDGITHHSSDALILLKMMLPNIRILEPNSKEGAARCCQGMVQDNVPWFIALRR